MRVGMAAAVAATMATVAAGGLSASAAAAPTTATGHPFTERLVGASIGQRGDLFENVFKVVSSVDGNGAAVQAGILSAPAPPDDGVYALTSYFADGVSKMKGFFHLTAPDSHGVSRLTGHGACAGGTGWHHGEKCTYTVTGTFNLVTNHIVARFTGEYR